MNDDLTDWLISREDSIEVDDIFKKKEKTKND